MARDAVAVELGLVHPLVLELRADLCNRTIMLLAVILLTVALHAY